MMVERTVVAESRSHDRWAAWTVAITAVVAPAVVAVLSTYWCGDSCYGEAEGKPAVIGFVVFAVGSLLGATLAWRANPESQRSLGLALMLAALPYAVFAGAAIGVMLGGGSGDYAVMTIVGYAYGIGCALLWLVVGAFTAVAGHVRLRHAARDQNPEAAGSA